MASNYYKKGGGAAKKAKIKTCPNPVFEKWIIELRDDAIQRDLQSKHGYTKCLNSLRKYPLPLHSGKECMILEGFGDKVCQTLDKKLETFLADGGKLHEDDSDGFSEPNVESTNVVNNKEINNETVKEKSLFKRKEKASIKKPLEESIGQINSNEESKIPKKSSGREYKPELRSSTYALLVALMKNETETGMGSMLKAELIKSAQKYCDASFSVSDGSSHYTAWSSMSTLTKKNLVVKSNTNPANYTLTEEGRNLASKLIESGDSTAISSTNDQSSSKRQEYNKAQTTKRSAKCAELKSSTDSDSDSDRGKSNNAFKNQTYKQGKEFKAIENIKPCYSKTKDMNECNAIVLDSSESDTNDDIVCISEAIDEKTTKKSNNFASSDIGNHPSYNSNDILLSLKPGTYEIILLVDTCETSHAKRQEIFLKELEKTGVKFEVSKLNIGDFTWIARQKSCSFQNTDLVLDYIVERKRVDDLCQSIIDGRYKEQKFRLKRSGIGNIIYLIENFGSMKNFSLPESTIKQAIVNTQIIDDFYVKESQNIKDSVNYLVQMTNYLIELHNGLMLHACLKEKVDAYYGKFSSKIEREKPHTYLMTFEEFNQNSNKNKPPTVKEMLGRCLIQINGLSQDKCITILEKYPTPCHLFSAYESCATETIRHKMLANLKSGKQNRNLGPAISKLLAQLFYK